MKGSTFGIWALSLSPVLLAACGSGGGTSKFSDGGAGDDGSSSGDDGSGGADTGTIHFRGDASTGDGGSGKCEPLTCEKLKYNCGPAGDGCGKTLECGTCKAPETCGGGGKHSTCGGSSACVPQTCTSLSINCGPAGDGCGGTLSCGTCTGSNTCGGGGTPSVCGTSFVAPDGGIDGGACVPKSCTDQSIACGPAGDGCGNTLDCGSCTGTQTCGGGGTPYQCGSNTSCIPTTCLALGFNCGPAADGCGGVLDCGDTCTTAGDICGGGGQPGVCGNKPTCTGLCLDQVACDGGTTTTLTGQVIAGTPTAYGKPDPVPNVTVYVPNSTPTPFPATLDCGCAPVSGDPVTLTTTDSNGMFTLTNVPVPASGTVPLVIQLGRWRRFVGLNAPVTKCTANTLVAPITMPHNKTEGDIPRTAISTGNVDAMECVLLKMGVDQAEFTNPGGTGSIQLYYGNGSTIDSTTTKTTIAESVLVPTTASTSAAPAPIDSFDQVIFPCWGEDPRTTADNQKTTIQQSNVIDYTTAGGRVFGTHFSYSWLYNVSPFMGTATWNDDLQYTSGLANVPNPGPTEPDVTTFYAWLNALPQNNATNGTFTVISPRNDFSAIDVNTSELWATVTGATKAIKNEPTSFPLIYTFATPVPPPAATECGKVIYSDMHVSVSSAKNGDTGGLTFPNECTTAAMSTQEKALEYLIWDLAACPAPPQGPSCTPATCTSLGYTCGPAGDGCGGTLDCGTCTTGCEVCGGGGTPSVCGGACCVPTTCTAQGIQCGPAGDGCGGTLACGGCPEGESCGGAGKSGVCGVLDGGSCKPLTCTSQGFNCGPAGDGCGGLLACGTCPSGETCGGGGKSGVCGKPACTPETCSGLGVACGPAGDGCGGTLQCGTCTAGAVCGGGGVPGQCYSAPK
jgi:hypothetical protein